MSHLDNTTLIKLAAEELGEDQRREAESHVSTCDACREALAKQRATYDLLSRWTIDGESTDQWPAIDELLDSPRPLVLQPAWVTIGRRSRIAAAVILGVGAGYFGGRFAKPAATPTLAPVSAQQALDAIGFSCIESPSASGLFTTVLDLGGETDGSGDAS